MASKKEKSFLNNLKVAMANFINRSYRKVFGTIDFEGLDELDKLWDKETAGDIETLSERYIQLKRSIANGSVKETVRGTALRNSTRGLNKAAQNFLKRDTLKKATEITDTVKDQFKTVFKEAADRNLSLAQTKELLRDRLQGMVKDGKIDTIARTEYNNAYSYGQNHALEQMEKKGIKVVRTWRTSGSNVRASHAKCDGEQRDVGEPFSNGLLYPGDPSGDASEVINCNCFIEPTVIEE